ncbi:hypothetical protein SAMN05444722_0479 [Rhodovulum sp. ES.010]|uniref:hypothetical protein n=1 Tax=Rhodovulum sp. ES.010 TaxID=1882821 RepID=UPI0009282F9F|nr:hypothetical protein [Rhodovulum sp. ES.010]SIO11636.1 hypothetical protein SAMN05444722_0479 [Rhodovulum sp. ES.010]
MQIIGPIPVVGYQDSGSQALAPAAPAAPIAAVSNGASAGQTRSETGERGQTPYRPAFPQPDPDRPAGPPPAFDTTPLQLEAERRQSEANVLWRNSGAPPEEPPARALDIEV